MNLYKITLHGMISGVNRIYGESYVVAEDPQKAYIKVKEFLDNEDIGFDTDRMLKSIELIASVDFEESNYKLYI